MRVLRWKISSVVLIVCFHMQITAAAIASEFTMNERFLRSSEYNLVIALQRGFSALGFFDWYVAVNCETKKTSGHCVAKIADEVIGRRALYFDTAPKSPIFASGYLEINLTDISPLLAAEEQALSILLEVLEPGRGRALTKTILGWFKGESLSDSATALHYRVDGVSVTFQSDAKTVTITAEKG